MRSDAWQVEAAFVPKDLEQAARLRRAIMRAGHAAQVANGIVGWLLGKAVEGADETASTTRAAYRRILESLPGAPRGPGEPPIMDLPSVTSTRRREAARAA